MNTKEYDGFSDSFRDSEHTHPDASKPSGLPEKDSSAHDSSREDADRPDPKADERRGSQSTGPKLRPAQTQSAPEREDHTGRREAVEQAHVKKSSTTAGLWVALILGALLLILLLVFVVQNNTPASFQYFQWSFTLPLGVAMLVAAVAGALIMAAVGSVRMMQMSWQLRKYRKQQERIQDTLHR